MGLEAIVKFLKRISKLRPQKIAFGKHIVSPVPVLPGQTDFSRSADVHKARLKAGISRTTIRRRRAKT